MDPITVATKGFLRDLERLWKRDPTRIARLVARPDDHDNIVKALRYAEYDPANRRPLFLHDIAFVEPEDYVRKLCERVAADYELVRLGAAEEGVNLAQFDVPVRPAALSADAYAMTVLVALAERFASHLDGVLVALIPTSVRDVAQWRKLIEQWDRSSRPASLRMAAFDAENGPLSNVLGSECARFSFDMDELFDYAQQQTNRQSAGPAVAPAPTLSPDQKAALEQSTGRKIAAPETATRLRALFLEAARAASKQDFKAAAGMYRQARSLAHDEGLAGEEVAATFALGGACLAAGDRPMAQAMYGQAALLGAQEKLWTIACQAKLGEAGIGWMEQDFGRAGRAYAEAAALAERGEIVPVRIEALRMEGLCHQQRGAEPEAIQAWRKAIEAGTAADKPARSASTFPDVVKTLADLLERRGFRTQADHLRTLLQS